MAIFGRKIKKKIIPAWKTATQMVKLWQSHYKKAALYENVSDNLNNRQFYQLGYIMHSCVHIC